MPHSCPIRLRFCLLFLLAPALLAQRNLIPKDAASVEAGKQIYMGSCSGCHGATGEGSQGPSLLSGRASRLPDQTLLSSIKNGVPGTSMPNFPMANDKVAQTAAFVRSLTAPAIAAQVPGDAARGRELFFGTGNCSTCHMIMGRGGHPGPDLSNIAAERTVHQIRESVTKPSERIADGFRGITLVMKSGQTLKGLAKNYNNYSVQLLDTEGKLHLLNRTDVASLQLQDASIMPPVSNATDAADLVAFLATQSTRPYEGSSR